MDGIKKTKRVTVSAHHASSADHKQRVQKSSTLNRRFVKKPTARPRVSASAAAAAKTLRRNNQTNPILTKKNTVRLQPLSARTTSEVKASAAKVTPKAVAPKTTVKAPSKATPAKNSQNVAVRVAKVDTDKLAAVRKAAAAEYAKTQQKATTAKQAEKAEVYQRHDTMKTVSARMAARKAEPVRMSAQEVKDRAIQQALRKMNQMDRENKGQISFYEAKQQKKRFWQSKKFALASAMAVISIAVLGYLVHLNMPDISVRVAAMQSGIEKAYPSYIPLNYRLDGLVKEDSGRITMNFKNDKDKTFSLKEEKTSWDSAAVLTNYVKKNWGGEYSIAKGQGLTIYVSGSNAAWVNGGVLYIIEDASNTLSSSDLHDIAVSL